jgi:hypothetical protein
MFTVKVITGHPIQKTTPAQIRKPEPPSPTIAWGEALYATRRFPFPPGFCFASLFPENEYLSFFLADMLKDRFRISAGNFDFHARLQRVLQ